MSAANASAKALLWRFTDVAVYTASLQEWAADPENPMETVTGPAGDTKD